MKVFPYTDLKKNLAKILEMVKNGEEIVVSNNKGKEKLAIILPYNKFKPRRERPLGILKGEARFKIKNDFKMSDRELLDS